MRRIVKRRPSGGGGGIGGGGVPDVPPLPANTVDYLHSLQRVTLDGSLNVQTWTSAQGKYAPTQAVAGNRPVYAPDTTLFRGKNVVQFATVGSKSLISPAGVQIFANASKPYVMTVARLRAYPAGTSGITHFTDVGVATNIPGLYGTPASVQVFMSGGANPTLSTSSTQPAIFETYLDAAGVTTIAVNGAVVSLSGTGGAISAAAVRMSVGGNVSAANFTDSSIAFQLTASALPTASERAALLAWAQAYWGIGS